MAGSLQGVVADCRCREAEGDCHHLVVAAGCHHQAVEADFHHPVAAGGYRRAADERADVAASAGVPEAGSR
ncbi:hypothetical protein GCM10011408_29190 [Dyella caseinilytica]|nr:hypothetical protein GCM10011408_29190 [Dyella caseinilytica]